MTKGNMRYPALSQTSHENIDLHHIGLSLPSPSVASDIVGGSASSVGTSTIPAREDHTHKLNDSGTTFPVTDLYEGRTFKRTDIGREYIYVGGSWYRLRALTGAGRMRIELTRAAVQVIATAVVTDVQWDTEVTDSENAITVPITNIPVPADKLSGTLHAGSWNIGARLTWSAAPGASENIRFVHSSGETIQFQGANHALTLNRGLAVPSYMLAAGNTWKIQVYQNSGANRNLTGKVWAEWISP